MEKYGEFLLNNPYCLFLSGALDVVLKSDKKLKNDCTVIRHQNCKIKVVCQL